jgi:hypothetical protein
MAETLTIQPDATAGLDTSIDSANPTVNYGTGTSMRCGDETSAANACRSLLKFDLSGIPTGSTILTAVLTVTLVEDRSSNERIKRVYRLKRAWTEGGATWNKYDGTNNWSTAGGFHADDCEQTDICNTTFSAAETIPSEKTFPLTASAVQEMFTGAFTNNGFMIKTDTETDDSYGLATSDHATASYRPKLVITYNPPSGGFISISPYMMV